jgi:polyferredoxin
MKERFTVQKVVSWRPYVQWCFLAWVIFIGIRFGMFVRYFESGGTAPFVARPPGVEGFLPIGALSSFKYWLITGKISPIHPAAMVIFLSVIATGLFAGKFFCSWLCPVGTLSEAVGKFGRKILGRNYWMWRPLDVMLRGVKYLLLLFFVKIILIDMSPRALASFLDSPYWAVSDVKMLHLFTRMSITTIVVLALLICLSSLYVNFWCRYLCPYGALLGLASLISPWKIRRDLSGCTRCGNCSASCPSGLQVHERTVVRSPECSDCLNCTAACPEKDVLLMSPPILRRPLPAWVFPLTALLVFAAGIGAGMATGNWHGSLTFDDYRQLIPMAPYLGH